MNSTLGDPGDNVLDQFELLHRVDFEDVVQLTSDLVKIPSPNPGGDVSDIASFLRDYLGRAGLDVEWIEPQPGHVNIAATIEGPRPGPHVVLNAHMDVFPVEEGETWSDDPLSGVVRDGRLFGRGSNDMKDGVATFVCIYRAMAADRESIAGKLTLMLVCDEESFGPWGARWLVDARKDLLGDVLLSTEPCGMGLIRTAERGMVWTKVTFVGAGGHGAHPVREITALRRARLFMDDVEREIGGASVSGEEFVVPAYEEAQYDACVGPGAWEHVRNVSTNFGTLHAGVKVNMQPARAAVEVDVRIPPGLSAARALDHMREIATRHGGHVAVLNFIEPNVTERSSELVRTFQTAVARYAGATPVAGPAPGCSDARLWRKLNIPAVGFGPYPHGMGGINEYCDLAELQVTVNVHQAVIEHFLFNRGAQE